MLVLLDRNKDQREKRRGRMGRLQKMYFFSPQEGYGTTSESPAISVAPTMTWRPEPKPGTQRKMQRVQSEADVDDVLGKKQ